MFFKDLPVGATFDFVDDSKPGYNSFFDRCKKVSARKYVSERTGTSFLVQTIRAKVFHVV